MNPACRLALLAALAAPLVPAQPRPNPKAQPNSFDRLRALPPEQRRLLLHRLPPDRRKQAEDRLERLERLSPAEQQELSRRYQFFQQLPPERQEEARRLYRDLNALPPRRNASVRHQIDQFRAMSSAERAACFQTREFKSNYTRKERTLLQDYVSLLESPSH